MRIGAGIALIAALAFPALAQGAAVADGPLCSEPDVKQATKQSCRTEPVLYRSGKEIIKAELAEVVVGMKQDIDVFYPDIIYFLRIPGQQIVSLDRSFPARSHTQLDLYDKLGYGVAMGGGLVRTNPALFYDQMIEKRLLRYCVVYVMKAPFTGELVDCDGRGKPGGDIGYLPGTIKASEAGPRVCAHAAAEAGQPCENNSVDVIFNAVRRDADGRLYYEVVTRRRVRAYPELQEKTSYGYSTPVEYDERRWRLDAASGAITFMSQESNLCGQKCTPLKSK